MIPTLQNKNLVIVNTNSVPKTLDLVCFRYNDKLLIKRLVGSENDHITLKDNILQKNGEIIKRYPSSHKQFYNWNIPEQSFIVLGDNLTDSLDSRKLGFISDRNIIGKAAFRIWTPKLL